mgnify:CR=1 FL=1
MRLFALLVFVTSLFLAPLTARAAEDPVVVFETTKGMVLIKLDPAHAPKSVANFLGYVKSGFYDNTMFHRVIKSKDMSIVQGGGFGAGFTRKATLPPIPCESNNGLRNEAGTIAMARTSDPDSGTSQFFINIQDNPHLNFRSATPEGMGYAVFGKVIRGMNVFQEIAGLRTVSKGMFDNVPVEEMLILKAYVYQER